MKQPKTIEEFMALPVRNWVSYEEFEVNEANREEITRRVGPERYATLLSRTIRFPVWRPTMAIAHEFDTIFCTPEWSLGCDDQGLCRRPR